MLPAYRSPARSAFWRRREEGWLAAEPTPGKRILSLRARARVPHALYLNYLARREFAAGLAPDCFRPVEHESAAGKTLFTILLFELAEGRPAGWPHFFGRLAPRVRQSNWRFYGDLPGLPEGKRWGVLFWRTVSDSLLLAAFGRRLARCFPLLRAAGMGFECRGGEVRARIEPGEGAAPRLFFHGRLAENREVPAALASRFATFTDYTRWVMNQRLSVTVWSREAVVQDMHLTWEDARVHGVEPEQVDIPALAAFVEKPAQPLSCFLAENLEVWLDAIRAVPRTRRGA